MDPPFSLLYHRQECAARFVHLHYPAAARIDPSVVCRRLGLMFIRRRGRRHAGRRAPALLRLESRCNPTTFVVSNTLDSGPGSLRQAVLDANGNPGADVIDATAISGT